MKQEFVVALKDATRIPGKIVPGKIFGHYHKREHAIYRMRRLLKTGLSGLDIGIFLNGQFLN